MKMKASNTLMTLVAIAVAMAATYYLVLPYFAQGKGGVILAKRSAPETKAGGGGGSEESSSGSASASSSYGSSSDSASWSSSGGGYIYRGPNGPISKYLASLPTTTVKGTSGPQLKAITLRIPEKYFYWKTKEIKDKNGDVTKVKYIPPGYYFVGSKICWESCGCGSKNVFNLVDLTNTTVPGEKHSILPLHSSFDIGNLIVLTVPNSPLEPVWYFYIPAYKVSEALPQNCSPRPYDYLIVDSTVLYAGDSTDPKNAKLISPWIRELKMRFDITPPASNRQLDVYSAGGVELVEVNGYVHMLIPQQSSMGTPLVVNVTLLECIVAILAVIGLIWWKVRKR